MSAIFDDPLYSCLFVFFARITDVSMATFRTILIVRGARFRAALIGFFEVIVWVSAASQVLGRLDRWYLLLCYACGFSTGNIVGVWLESKLAIGNEMVRVLSKSSSFRLAERLREQGWSVTKLAAEGDTGSPIEVLLIVEARRKMPALLGAIRAIDPEAIWTINDVKRMRTAPLVAGPIERAPMAWLRRMTKRG
ncbi:MAG: DUF2179 domain-containing protein [Planctomycetes bacterium]|nr:DUF2179 domain-containing protein [Planctomycetota bacterium]